jgi:uncharacterized protein YbaP (TraB family)
VRRFGKRLTAVISIGWVVGVGPACDKRKSDEPAPQPKSQAAAQVSPAERTTAEPRPAAETDHRPFLYRIDKAGKVSWLLGTMHLGFDYQELPKQVWSQLGASRKVVLELDLAKAMPTLQAAAQLPPGTSLRGELGDAAFDALTSQLAGMPPEQIDRMRPWAAAQMLLARLYPTALPLDLAVMREAQRAGVELSYLENAELQLGLIEKVLTADTVKQLVDEQSAMRQLLAEGAAAYQKGDYDRLMKVVLDPAWYGDADTLEAFLYRRNDAWVDSLLPELTRGGLFVAVGAGHLGGDRGLIAQLEKQGFTVTRTAD